MCVCKTHRTCTCIHSLMHSKYTAFIGQLLFPLGCLTFLHATHTHTHIHTHTHTHTHMCMSTYNSLEKQERVLSERNIGKSLQDLRQNQIYLGTKLNETTTQKCVGEEGYRNMTLVSYQLWTQWIK